MTSLAEIQSSRDEPLYNIGVVSRMTGLTMATLRAWERRYDFPDAKRTLGGHRLYSEQDIFRLRWVKERIDEGMQTAQAILALRHQEETGLPVLTGELLTGGLHRISEPRTPGDKVGREERRSFFASSIESLLEALLARETQGADNVLAEV